MRPISISNCFAQIFEKIVLLNSPMLRKTSKNQFGFKQKTSCNHAIFAVKETIINYIEKKSSCRLASLDAEKAFDKLWRNGLFYKLLDKIDTHNWFILKKYYDNSKACIKNSNYITNTFTTNCGVKQGGILSSFLFNSYIDDLITECLSLKIGATIGDTNTSIIAYADDIMLISPNDSHLQSLLNVCTLYGNQWRIKFNPNKSNIISFGKSRWSDTQFTLNQQNMKETTNIKYLGIEINNLLDFNTTSIENFKKVQKSVFSLAFMGLKPMLISPKLQSFIYKTYCLSKFTYGLETITINKTTRDYINSSQNQLLRQIIGLNKYCRMTNIRKCLQILNFEQLYIVSKLSFLQSINNNEISVKILNYLLQQINDLSRTSKSFGNDLVLIKNFFNLDIVPILVEPLKYKQTILNGVFNYENNGICESINLCLDNYRDLEYRNLLKLFLYINFYD